MKSMVKNSILFFLLILMGTICGQTTKIDSLKNELVLYTKKDTTRVNLLNELAFSYFSNDLAKSIEYLDESEVLADDVHFKKGKARSLYINGLIQSSESNNEKAIELFKRSLSLYEEEGLEKAISDCYAAIGLAFYNKNEYNEANKF
jgi:tetratricopeptide (TPR) repeat protein